jgi:hypothetical protein
MALNLHEVIKQARNLCTVAAVSRLFRLVFDSRRQSEHARRLRRLGGKIRGLTPWYPSDPAIARSAIQAYVRTFFFGEKIIARATMRAFTA